jgi:GAF domain-containing protein
MSPMHGRKKLTRSIPVYREQMDVGGIRTLLDIGLRKGDALLGIIALYRQEVRPFTDKQIALLQSFAAQAVIAMENARLLTETREALEQQTATAEVLGVINASPGNLTPVFEAMLEKALSLCDVGYGCLRTYDGRLFHPVADRGNAQFSEIALGWEPFEPLPGSPPARIASGEAVIQIADLVANAAREPGNPRARALVEIGGARTAIWVAMRNESQLLGYITAYRQEAKPFTDKQIALLQSFAAQAVIAMENARLLTETREALEQQTATAEVLQVINSSPGDLAPVFDAMLEKAVRLCGANFGGLTRVDGEDFHYVAMHNVPPAFAESMRQPRPIGPGVAHYRLLNGEEVVQVQDVTAEDIYRSGEPGRRALADLGGARTVLWAALRKDNTLLGAFVIYRKEVRPFTNKEIALLQNFAAQAVIAMENARLLTETREALEQQTATAEVLQVINSSPGDLTPVFDAMLAKATRLCEAPFGHLRTWDGECFHLGAVHGEPQFCDWVRQRGPIRPDRYNDATPLGRIIAGERVVSFVDVPGDERYRTSHPGFREMAEASGVRSAIWVALHKDDVLLGTITVYRREIRPFTDKQIALLQNFAAQAVIAMENARLITETREALEQQTATAEVLGVINASPGDLTPVFDAMLEKAHSLCGAAKGALVTFNGELFRAVATRGLSEAFGTLLREPRPAASASSSGRLLRGENLVHIPDIRAEEGLMHRAAVEHEDARTVLFVPLRKDGALLGVITAFRQEVRPFSEKQINLLQNFAAQAVIAMENARLLTETREALEQQTATAEILSIINNAPGELSPVFEAMLDQALRLCEGAFGTLFTFDGDFFHQAATRNRKVPIEQPFRAGPKSAGGRLLRGEPFVHIADARDDEAYRSGDPSRMRLVKDEGARSYLAVPMRKGEVLLGNIAIYRLEVRPFTDKQIALLQNFAAQAVIAMENARLLGELRKRTDEVAELNHGLEARVAEQVDELGRVGRLKRFLAPQLAELIVSQGDEKILESHRRDIVVVFCDLRGYTAFTETAEPEEVLDFLREYHGALGPLVSQFEGTLDQFSGDGIMVFFNDPVPCPDPAERAVKMAMAMREAAGRLIATWRHDGCELGFGAGIAQGYATLGQIGFSERSGYTAIGTVCNLAARLCAEAKDGQILISSRVARAVEAVATLEDLGNLELRGLRRPVAAFNVVRGSGAAEVRPNLTVVTSGPAA